MQDKFKLFAVTALSLVKKYFLIIFAITVFSVSITCAVVAKYVFNDEVKGTVSTPEFYFNSDVLSEIGTEYHINANVTKLSINLYNFEDELNTSTVDIVYTLTVTDSSDTVIKTQTNIMSGNFVTETVNFPVNSGETYKVSVEGNGGFKKTLSATFIVATDSSELFKNIQIYDNYVILTVWTTGTSAEDINVSFPKSLIPDNTDPDLKDVITPTDNYGDFTFDLDQFSSKSFRFFIGEGYSESTPLKVTFNSENINDGTLS